MRRFALYVLPIILIVATTSCTNNGVSIENSGHGAWKYYPLTPGNSWSYDYRVAGEEPDPNSVRNLRVEEGIQINGFKWHRTENATYYDTVLSGTYQRLVGDTLFSKRFLRTGEIMFSYYEIFPTDLTPLNSILYDVIDGDFRVQGIYESLNGRFENEHFGFDGCLVIKQKVYAIFPHDEELIYEISNWYKEGIGEVKEEAFFIESERRSSWELISYSVGQ